ncbi:hypothetical protein KO499_18860 [Marinobacter sp. F3R08]|nr:hypothetical protein [Marinobacter sp. F3R08]
MGSLELQSCREESAPGQKWYKPIICINTKTNGEKRLFKTYRYRQGPLGQYFRLLASHEYRMLTRVSGLAFTPQGVERDATCSSTISYRYVDGAPIKEQFRKGDIPDRFFFRLYQAVSELHEKGIAHLDVGNSGNIVVSPEGNPVLIDFGSSMLLKRLPVITRAWARKRDLLGVLKLWRRYDDETMPDILRQYYERYYRKNIYTPKRFFKACKRYWLSDGEEMSELGAVAGIFFMLWFLITIV